MSFEGDYYHAGFVLTPRYNADQIASVLDMNVLNDMGVPKIREINNDAFRLRISLEDPVRKNLERKLGEALIFGDMIDYHVRDTRTDGSIDSFDRIRPFFESRVLDGHGQILLEGVVNPNDASHLWTPYFKNLEIPRELQDEVEPNIFVEVWINLEMSENNNLSYSFHSFHGVCDRSKQMDINLAPWNIGHARYDILQMGDEFVGSVGMSIEQDLYREEAYMTGPRSFLLTKLPQYKCTMVIKNKEQNMQIGGLYLLDCMWNGYERNYLVLRAVFKKDGKTLSADATSRQLRCSVHAHEDYLGLFYQKDTAKDQSLFGLVDDPNGVLALLHLSKIKNNAIPVSLSDPGPNRCGQMRFRVEKVMGDKKEKLEKFAQEEIALKNVSGVVIDEDHVFSARHTLLLFMFGPSETAPPPGTRVHLDGVYRKEDQKFVITSWSKDTDVESLKVVRKRLVAVQPTKKQFAFNIKVKICPARTLNKMFYSDVFGLLDDNLGLIEIDQNNRAAQYDVWVKRSEQDIFDCQPRTVFHVIGIGKKEAKDRVEAPIETEETKAMRQQFEETVRKTAISPSTGSRFSAPKTKSQAPEDPALSSRPPSSRAEVIKPKVVEQPKKVEEWSVEKPTITFDRFSAPSTTTDKTNRNEGAEAPRLSSSSRFSAPIVKKEVSAPSSRFSAPGMKAGPSRESTNFAPDPRQDRPSSVQIWASSDTCSAPRPISRFSAPGMNRNVAPQRSLPTEQTKNSNFSGMSMGSSGRQVGLGGGRSSRACEELHESQSRGKRLYPMYDGAVRLPAGAASVFDVTETLGRLNQHIRHSPACKQQCSSTCPNLKELVVLFNVPGFFDETTSLFPQIVHEMVKRFPH